MLHTRDAQGYLLHGVNVVPERPKPKPKYPLRDLVKLWQEASQREKEAHRREEHWHCAYDNLNQEYLALKDGNLCPSNPRVEGETECSTGRETRKSLERVSEAGKSVLRAQILARVLRNLIERTREKHKKK